MRCCSKKHQSGGNGGRIRGRKRTLLFGMLAGLVIGLLIAPKPGAETMDSLRDLLVRKLPV